MTRHILLATLLALLSTQALAEEPRIQFANDGGYALNLAPTSNTAKVGGPDALRVGYDLNLDFQEAADNEAPPPEVSPATDGASQCFQPVCDCGGCSIPMLDVWCVCDTPCCTTDCWAENPCQCSQGNCYLAEDGTWVSNDAFCDIWDDTPPWSNSALRFGWWGVDADGSPVKTGEYQDLKSSPFWDVDAISSDGVRTWNLSLSGLDNEANFARARYFGENISAKVDYQRYLRHLDHDPLTGYDLANPAPPGADDNVVSEDLNVGKDYAIRIQELDARLKGRLTDNLKWKLNLWGQRKFGDRQTNAVAHCYQLGGAAGNTCHIVSQSQRIDWLTMEIQPVIEAEFDNVTVEYSRTMRSFGQTDGLVTRQYTHFSGFSPANDVLGPDYAYSLVPDNYTQIDRVKIGAQLTENNQLYANLFVGDTKNKFRGMHRNFGGYDLRVMNSAFEGLNLTGYVNWYKEDNELPPFYLTSPPYAPANTYDEDSVQHPVDYTRTRAGVKARYRPFGDSYGNGYAYGWGCGTSIAAGYEYYQLDRDYATYDTNPQPPGPFTQPNTITHKFEIGPSTRWSQSLQTFTRYKVRFVDVPLIGVSEYSEDDPDVQGTFNTNLPEQVHAIDIGGTWTPTANFMATVQFSIENSWNTSQYANFSEDNYPMVCTLWYAPTNRLSFTGGYAYYSNWIDQDITLGANRGDATETETTRWNYAGENHLVSLNVNYAWTECVQLVGGYEWNRGSNMFSVPASPAGADWSLLPTLSDVLVETQRVTAGLDWQPNRNLNVYFRYILFDYDDLSSGQDSGVSQMALGGAALNW